jgi:glycosyltransferase involved in cell wall biosynthesis
MAGLQQRAASRHPNVIFAGFSDDVAGELSRADLLLHTCPVEPFGLVILEAMAASVPVLAPDSGGAGSLIEEGVSGFKFRADDAAHLAARLAELSQAQAEILNRVVAGGRKAVGGTFSASAALEQYRRLFAPK